ncbi:MAG: hypothetical protein IJY61_00130 [Candidatus Gastranaerophilales bacterium]|nr:hypothetical protein [Candidatus Gastranaerophilales bacterium]
MITNKNNNDTLKKLNTLAQVLFCVKFFRFVFFFYSFLSFVFWFLNCFEVDWLYLFNWLFVIPYQAVGTFYRPEGVSADFSLAIIGGITLLLGFIFNSIVDYLFNKVLDLEEEEQRRIEAKRLQRRKKRTTVVNPQQQQSEITSSEQPQETSKLIYIIQPHINKIKRKEEDLELTFQEVELWKQRVNKKLLENISYSKPMQKGYYRKNLFLMYRDFNYVDDFLYYIKPTLDSIILEFRKYGVSVSFSSVLSSIAQIENLEKELDCMDTILSLNFINDFIVTIRFKVTYDNKPVHQYQVVLKGEYNLSKNLTISNKQPLFALVDMKKRNKEKEE